MIVVTSESIAGKRVVRTLGLVRGNTVRARHIGRDILAGLRNIVGGEVHEYGKLVAESREQSLERMITEAEELGAIVGSFCPNILFPYARETIASTIQKGGFPEFVLQPINFDALYLQAKQQAQGAAAEAH